MLNTLRSNPFSLIACAGLCIAISSSTSLGQARQIEPLGNQNPIYIADSPIASDAMVRIQELLAQKNYDEAVRLCDEIILNHGDRLIQIDADDPNRIHIPVRHRVHSVLLSDPELLRIYQRQIGPKAATWLNDNNQWQRASQDAWLTEAGLIASLRLTQTLHESGRFYAGLAMLDRIDTHPNAKNYAQDIQRLRALGERLINASPPISHVEYSAQSLNWTSQPQAELSLDGVVPGVLANAMLTPVTQTDLSSNPTPSRLSGASWKPTAWCSPLVENQYLFTNDGYTISCFDRFTLRPIWRVQTFDQNQEIPLSPDSRARLGRLLEDMTSVSSDQQSAIYAAAGSPRNSESGGVKSILKLDKHTGAKQWQVELASLDQSLQGASIRGPILIDQGTVVVLARTNNRRQRLISLTMIGLDAATGQLRWLQPLASAGSLPFQQTGQLAHAPVIRQGVAYYSDLIGFATAIRVATGEVLWARPLPAPDLYARSDRPVFAGNAPVINKHGLFVLTSDGSRILQIDPKTGSTIALKPTSEVTSSYYLLAINDDRFACVSDDRISVYQADRFATSSSRRTPVLGGAEPNQEGIRGRVVVAGNTILAPVERGIRMIQPDQVSANTLLQLDATGNIAALDGQVLVVDQMEASSFLAWETASSLLEERISVDPSAAVTIAELAHRTSRIDDIVPSVERALRVINTQASSTRQPLRNDLFLVVLDIVRPIPNQSNTDPGTIYESLGQERVEKLLRFLGELARTHEQAVAHRMQLGETHERYRNFEQAIIAYQDILDQATLRSAMWEGADVSIRAGLEASRRIGAIIQREGYNTYRNAEQRAIAEIEFLGSNAQPQDYEAIAQRFPWSSVAPSSLLQAAQRFQQADETPSMIEAARSGIESINQLSALGIDSSQDTLESLAEILISGLISTNRSRDALTAARTILENHPQTTLRQNGRVVTLDQLASAAGDADKLPKLGSTFVNDADPVLVTGTPIRPAHRIDPGGVLLYAPQLGRLQYCRVGPNVFEPFWDRKAPGTQPPLVLWQGPARTLVFWPESVERGDTGTIECIITSTGKLAWNIEDARIMLEQGSARVPDNAARVDSLFAVPAQGSQAVHQLMVVTDGQSVIVTDRIGRAMGIDLYTGTPLWQRDLPVNRVHDIDLQHGRLGVCGLVVIDRAQEQRNGSITPLAASIDPRTGETGQVTERFGHQPRWIRVGDRSRMFVASTQRITAINVEAGSVDWVVNSEEISDSQDAWVSGSDLLVLNDRNRIWALDPDDGSRANKSIDTRSRITSRGWIRMINEIGRSVLLSNQGFVSFDQNEQTIAVDALSRDESLVDIAWGQNHAVGISTPNVEGDQLECRLIMFDNHNATQLDSTILRIPAAITRRPSIALPVNGGILVGFDEVSVFVRTED